VTGRERGYGTDIEPVQIEILGPAILFGDQQRGRAPGRGCARLAQRHHIGQALGFLAFEPVHILCQILGAGVKRCAVNLVMFQACAL